MQILKALVKSANFGISILLLTLAVGFIALIAPIGGNKALIVRSGSMQPAIGVGDLITVKPKPDYKTREIVAFKDPVKSSAIVTHRIVGKEIKNNQFFYQTKGDANEETDFSLIPDKNIIGRADFSVKGIGKLLAFTKTKEGFLASVALPALLVILLEINNIIKEVRKIRTGGLVEIKKSIKHIYHHYGKPMGLSYPSASFKSLISMLSLRGLKGRSNLNNRSLRGVYSERIRTARDDKIGLGFRTVLPILTSLLLVGNTFSYFSDTETSTGNIFQAAADFCNTRGEIFAAKVVTSSQGDRKDGTNVLPERSDPTNALGVPDGIGSPASGFFSLGFADVSEQILTGSITLEFGSFVKNGDGADLSVHEITNGRITYPLEKAQVEVSADGTTWDTLGEATSKPDAVTLFDFSSNGSIPSQIKFVRITDTTNPAIHTNDADGFDLDSVDAKYGCTDIELRINEFVANPGTAFLTEWVEIYNLGATAVNLTDWTIKDAAGIATHSLSELGTIDPISFKTKDIAEGFLNNTGGDTVKLINPTSTIVDSHTYTGSVADDQSIGRDIDGTGTFKNCTIPTKGSTNNGSC